MRKGKNNLFYYTVEDVTRIVNGEGMGDYYPGEKRHIEKNYISVLLTRLANESSENFNDDYRKRVMRKKHSQMGRPTYEYTAYFVDKVLNLISQSDEDSLSTSLSAKNMIKNNTLTVGTIRKIFNNVSGKNSNLNDSSYDLQQEVFNSIYRKDRRNRKKILAKLDEMRSYRDNEYNMLENRFHEIKESMDNTYRGLINNKFNDSKKLSDLKKLLNLNYSSWDKRAFIHLKYEMLDLIDTKSLNSESLSKIFNNYEKKGIVIVSQGQKEKLISQIVKKNTENQENLKSKVIEFTKEAVYGIDQKQGQINMLFSYLTSISDFLNDKNINSSDKLKLSTNQLALCKSN